MRYLAVLGVLVTIGLIVPRLTPAAEPDGGAAGYQEQYSFPAELNLESDICHHDQYIWGADHPPPHNIKLDVSAGYLDPTSITGPAPWVRVSAWLVSNQQFVASGTGTVAGYPDIPVQYTQENSADISQRLSGVYRMGVDGTADVPGHLPPCDDDNNPDTPPMAHAVYYRVKAKGTATPAPTATPAATPTVPQQNGSCSLITYLAFFQGEQWDQWKCSPSASGPPFNRVDIFAGSSSSPVPQLTAGRIVCQGTHEKRVAISKGRRPSSPPGTYVDVWSVDFEQKCVEGLGGNGVDVYIQPQAAGEHPAVGGVAFSDNQPSSGTPTITPTAQATGTVTQTPTATWTLPPGVTPTATPTYFDDSCVMGQGGCTPTPTAPPQGGDGDCDHNASTNALDALLVLQYTAGLIPHPGGCGDVNRDQAINAIDGTLILQYIADFIDHLPWP